MKKRLSFLRAVWAAALLVPLTGYADTPAAEAEQEQATWDVSNPPGEWRSINIDTDETTWSEVDVSPDGRSIAFDMLGDIYTVSISGGQARPLAQGIEWNYQPRFSPDGKSIAFISDRAGGDNLWVMNADGSEPYAVTDEGEHIIHTPNWSPDNQYLVGRKSYTSTRSIAAGEIWMYHRSGGAGVQLVERPLGAKDQKNIAEPAFSPDGKYLYYSQDVSPGSRWQYNKDSTGSIFAIKRLELETGKTDTVVSGPGGAIRPTLSPDGKQLAYVKRVPGLRSALMLKDLQSGKEVTLYDQLERDLQETNGSHGNTAAFDWTPNGRSIIFWSGGKIRSLDVASKTARVIPVRISAQKKIQPALRVPVEVAPAQFKVKMPRWAQYVSGQDKVVFQALGHIYVKDLSSGKQKRLTKQNDHYEFYPVLSPDGKTVVYTTWDDEDLGTVRSVSVRGGKAKVLTEQPGHYVEPAISNDGKQVLYRKMTGGYLLSPIWSEQAGIYRVDINGGTNKRIIDNGFNAQFNRTGERIYFSATTGELDTELLLKSVNLNGKDEREHLQVAKATEFKLSPDERWIAFTENFNAYVAPFFATGKKVSVSGSAKSMPVKQISKRAGEFITWSADSQKLHWNHGPHLFTRDLKEAFSFLAGAPEELPEPVDQGIDLSFTVDYAQPDGAVVLSGGRVVTMRDADQTQEILENTDIVIEGNRITALGRSGTVAIPSGAEVIDISGKTVIPGLVDAHAHGGMGMDEIMPQQNWMQFSNLAFGVTTVHDPSNDTSEVFAAAELQKTGQMLAPRIFSTGTILYGAHVPGYSAKISNLDDARFHVQRLKDVGAISVKSYNQPRRDQRQQVLAAAQELGIMVFPEGGAKFQHNMNMVVDGHTGIEHALPIKDIYSDVMQLWGQTSVGYTPTFGVAYGGMTGELYWYDRTNVWENQHLMRFVPRSMVEPNAIRRSKAPDSHYNHFGVAASAKRLRDNGVSVQIGAHGQREGLAAHWEMWMMGQGGFTAWEALRGATIDGAKYLGMQRDIGSIEVGKLADLAVIDGPVLEDIRQSEKVVFTVINGAVFDTTTMHQIAPAKKQREAFFFEREGGDAWQPATMQALEQKAQRFGWRH